jgi:hypothetical protein
MCLVALCGCGGGTPSVSGSTAEATVKGTVTINGKKATGGEVVFDPSNYRRANQQIRKAPIDKGGNYTVKTLVGENTITVMTPETRKDIRLQSESLSLDAQDGKTFDIVLPVQAETKEAAAPEAK